MKKHIFTAVFLLLILAPALSAQALRGSYFFETSPQRGKLNAAFAPQVNYVSVPLLGAVGYDAFSNVGLGNFVFPSGGNLYTFLHENVPADTFLGKLPAEDPYYKGRMEMDLLGAGFRLGGDGFMTVGLSMTGEAYALLPGEFLRFAKQNENGSYPGPLVEGTTYGVLSLGYSHDLSALVEGLRIGGRIKLLAGLYAGSLNLSRLDVAIQADNVSVATQGEGYLAGATWNDKKIQFDNAGIRGIGAAVDLGIEYRLKLDGFINGVNLSASVNNLGKLGFNKGISMLTTGATASFSGLNGISSDYDFKGNLDRVVDDFSRLATISSSPADSYEPVFAPSIYAGVEVPFLREMMSVGVLYYRAMGFDHVMASYNVSPVSWLNIGINGTFLGAANTYGCYAEFIPKKWVGVFFGLEKASLKTNPQHIPIENFTESACLGVNIVFGGK